jgi:hypothetical protein
MIKVIENKADSGMRVSVRWFQGGPIQGPDGLGLLDFSA